MEGQSVARQDRDRYECHRWAVKKTGFDPGRTPLAPHQRVEVISEPPPGTNTAAGAVSGAMIGALLSRPHDTGEGLVFGAITGAVLGAASESAQQQRTRQLQYHYDKDYTRRYARAERQAHNFRRAMTACLEGRGYSVR
jgi:outer membrane lipoprotein SlyB